MMRYDTIWCSYTYIMCVQPEEEYFCVSWVYAFKHTARFAVAGKLKRIKIIDVYARVVTNVWTRDDEIG